MVAAATDTCLDLVGRQAVGQASRTFYFNPVVKYEHFDGIVDEIIAVNERVDQQFVDDDFGYLRVAETVKIFAIWTLRRHPITNFWESLNTRAKSPPIFSLIW